MRPLTWPYIIVHLSIGFLLANRLNFDLDITFKYLLGVLVWILGSGGTLAFNSFYDKDKGSISWLNNPPPMPRKLLSFSLILLFLGLILSFFVTSKFFIVYLICFILAIMYSHPSVRLKSIPGLDVLTNALGYGVLVFYSGWAITNKPLNFEFIILLLAIFFLAAGAYPLTQIYQYEEDKKRGDKTTTIFLGKKRTLLLSSILTTIGFLIFFYVVLTGYLSPLALIITPALSYFYWRIFKWYKDVNKVDAKKEMYKASILVILTDLAIIIAVFV